MMIVMYAINQGARQIIFCVMNGEGTYKSFSSSAEPLRSFVSAMHNNTARIFRHRDSTEGEGRMSSKMSALQGEAHFFEESMNPMKVKEYLSRPKVKRGQN